MSWEYFRDRYSSANAAVDNAPYCQTAWDAGALRDHPIVKMALQQIDMAERAIASVADEMVNRYEEEA
jgi:hypothetical protein